MNWEENVEIGPAFLFVVAETLNQYTLPMSMESLFKLGNPQMTCVTLAGLGARF
jgi:hypothetical protein